MNRREEILRRAEAMPVLRPTAVRAVQILHDPDVEVEAVVEAVELDPGLTANLLRIANSSLMASSCPIDTVRDAVVRLGFDRVLQLVLATTVRPVAHAGVAGYDLGPGELWRHSVAVGLATQISADVLRAPAGRAGFTAGLLHDIGRIALGEMGCDAAEEIIRIAFDQNLSFDAAERAVLGIDHGEVGAALLEHWGIPASVVEVVRWHHEPSGATSAGRLVDLVHVADHLMSSSGIGLGRDGLQYRLDHAAAERVGMRPEHADTIVCRARNALARLQPWFEPEGAGRS